MKRRKSKNNVPILLTETKLLEKLAVSRKHASEGKLRDAEDVVADMRIKYKL